MRVQHRFVDFIPDIIEDGILYISLGYGTVIHKCACGCGNEVNTPLNPTGWEMVYNGETISLKPSIGNWSFDCKSHYWIVNNKIKWSVKWNNEKIKKVRREEGFQRQKYYRKKNYEAFNTETLILKPKINKKKWFYKFLFWK